MIDFTLKIYLTLLDTLIKHGYSFQTFSDYLLNPGSRVIVLRHDVDARKMNSLQFALLQHNRGITGSYYFRMVPQSFDEGIIRKIAAMGHEIGYHYETMDIAKGNVDEAYNEFCRQLEILRKLVPIRTICMHGSPLSPFDNKALWDKYNYKNLDIIGEPYFDIDYSKVAYLTDTGRRWNGAGVSVRDKVKDAYNFNFTSTNDLINNISKLPDQAMITFHPQRWSDHPLNWTFEFVSQTLKNPIKRLLLYKNQLIGKQTLR
jgi:hypothetical protein